MYIANEVSALSADDKAYQNNEEAIEPYSINPSSRKGLIRSYTFAELKDLYNMSYSECYRMLKRIAPKIGKRLGHWYTVEQVTIIFDEVGPPFEDEDEQQ